MTQHRTAVVTITITKRVPSTSATNPSSDLAAVTRGIAKAFDAGTLVSELGTDLTIETTFAIETTDPSRSTE